MGKILEILQYIYRFGLEYDNLDHVYIKNVKYYSVVSYLVKNFYVEFHPYKRTYKLTVSGFDLMKMLENELLKS